MVRATLEDLIPVQFVDPAEVPSLVLCCECSLIIPKDNKVIYDQKLLRQ